MIERSVERSRFPGRSEIENTLSAGYTEIATNSSSTAWRKAVKYLGSRIEVSNAQSRLLSTEYGVRGSQKTFSVAFVRCKNSIENTSRITNITIDRAAP